MNFLNKSLPIKDVISPDLALRNSAEYLFKVIDRLSDDRITVDFTGVKSITRSFADEYLNRKKSSKKMIIEINVSDVVTQMFDVIEKKPSKFPVPKTNKQKALLLKLSV